MGDGGFADVTSCWEHSHALAVFGVAAYITFYAPGVFRKVAPHQSLIAAVGIVVEELCAQLRLGFWCLGNNKQSAGVFINTMYQTHAGIIGVVTGQIAQVPRNGVDQGTVEITHAWMYYQSCGFINHHQLVVFIDDIQWNILRFNSRIIVWTVKHQRDDIARTNLIVTLDRCAVDLDESGIGSFLDAVARRVLHVFRHIFINAHRLLPTVYFHAQMLIQLAIFDLKVEIRFAI